MEGASSNLFWIDHGRIFTPPLSSGVLAGVTRSIVIELCRKLNLPCDQTNLKPGQLLSTDGVFMSLSSLGILEATALDNQALGRSPITARLREAYLELLYSETRLRSFPDSPP